MALQVWLPLTKQQSYIENWGICSPIDITNSGAVFNANGKIGNCYTFTDKIIKTTVPANLKNQFSSEATLAMWIKLSSSHSAYAQALTFGTVGTSWNNILLGIDINGNGVPIGNISNGTNYTNCSFSTAIKDDTWHHLAFIYNNGTLQSYMDGVLKNTVTTTYVPAWTSISVFSIGGNSTETLKNGDAINDVRLYNHALSKREIKEISKGLVVHYMLSKPDNPNYFLNSNFYNSTTTNWYGVNSSSPRIETKDGHKCITGTKGTTNNICGQTLSGYSYVANSQVTFTISADVYVEETGTFGIGNWISTTEASGWQGMSGSQRWNTPNVLSVGWNHISAVRVNGTNQYNGSIVTAFSYTGTTYWITNIKFEFGDKETPWLPNSSDSIYSSLGYGGNIEYDCSGYQNNGIKVGTLESNSDTPRNTSSLIFGASKGIYCTPTPVQRSDGQELTVSCWFKQTIRSGYQDLVVNRDGNGYNWMLYIHTTDGSIQLHGKNQYKSSIIPELNIWHHVVAVVYTNKTYSLYLDGIKVINATSYEYQTQTSNSLCVGKYGTTTTCNEPFQGQISDVRIYATALSDADILELYNSPINFNKHSTMIQGEFIEK